jgi:hypothetical protein
MAAPCRSTLRPKEIDEMIPIKDIRVINGPDDVFTFPATADITEIAFRPRTMRIVFTKQGKWPPVDIENKANADDDQEATVWVILKINGEWCAAGMERLRPNQTDKPEGDDPFGFIAAFVENRNFGPFNGHTPRKGDPIGFMVVAGNTRLGAQFTVKERSKVIEMTYPPQGGRPVWVEGQVEPDVQPDSPEPVVGPLPAVQPGATKADVDAARAEILARIDRLEANTNATLKEFKPLLERITAFFK